MRKAVLVMIVFFAGMVADASAFTKKDTTIIEFTDKGIRKRVTVYTSNNKTFEAPKVLNLENLLKQIGVDSSEREKVLVLIGSNQGKQDTIFAISREGQKIKILTKDPFVKEEKDTVIVKQPEEIVIEKREDDFKSSEPSRPAPRRKFFSRSDFGIYIGLNNFMNAVAEAPDRLHDLRTWQSRYVALSFRKNATLIRGEKMDWALSYGPEIAWYNFMFDNSNVARYEDGQVSFVKYSENTKKSKLVMPYLNFPVLLNFGFKQEKFKFGVGGYIGYRVGGYSKIKPVSGDRIIEKSSYGMNKVVYGLTTEFGRKNGFTFFFRYDLNKLFKENQTNANDIQAFSVGLRL